MSTIDRRAFFAGCLAVTVAGCIGEYRRAPSQANKVSLAAKSCVAAPTDVSFFTPTNGCWTLVGNAQVYVIT